MSQFTRIVITEGGQALTAKMMIGESAGAGNVPFTRIATSSQIYDPELLEQLSALDDIRQETLISAITRTNNTAIRINGVVNNVSLVESYHCNTIGIYATDPDEGEILYGVTIVDLSIPNNTPDFIPAFNGVTSTGIKFDLIITVGNASSVSLEINPAAVATIGDLDEIYSQIAWFEHHTDMNLESGEGVHGIRYVDGKLQVMNENGWDEVNGEEKLVISQHLSDPNAHPELMAHITDFIPKYHASDTTDYGIGNENLYGHVKLTDDIESTAKANDSIGVSPFGLAKIRAELTEKMYSTLDFPAHVLIRAVSTEDDEAVPDIPFSVSVNQEPEMIYTTKADGEIRAAGLGGDRMYIKPAEGIMWTSTPEFITVDLVAEQTVDVEFALTPIPVGFVKIIAESSTGARLAGRQFTVTVSGETAQTLTTDTNGEISVVAAPDKTVTAVLKDLGLGASVNQSSSVTTVVGGVITPTVFTLTASIGTVLTYTASTTITLDPMITTIDVYASGAGGGGGGCCTNSFSGRGGNGGNGIANNINNYTLTNRILKITIGAKGVGGVGGSSTTPPKSWSDDKHYYVAGANGTVGGSTSVIEGAITIATSSGGGGGGGGGKLTYINSGAGARYDGQNGSPNGTGRGGGGGSSYGNGTDGQSGEAKITIKGAL